MQDQDPFSPGLMGAALAVLGLAALMLGEPASTARIATAAACLVMALAAFAVAGLRRLARRSAPQPGRTSAHRPPTRAPAPAQASAAPVRVSADVVLTGHWSMPLSQRDPRVHAALSMPVRTFQAGDPPDGAEVARHEAALAELRARRIAGRD